ncbi:MAG TPA: VOC family protein [Acidimicrobiia bacterium]|jgi:predicted enzyme related to lactoylglutathione lyase|nr:VOC family protein [Acidimicrobiia bacterium]
MGSRWYTVVVDATNPALMARFWAAVLDYQIVFEQSDEVVIAKDTETYPGIIFVPVPEPKSLKNRLHIDLNPDNQDAEVARLLALGAKKVDVGQTSEVKWVVMADPEGNEFCVLTARDQ